MCELEEKSKSEKSKRGNYTGLRQREVANAAGV